MAETRQETRSPMTRRRFIKRWLILLGIGLLLGFGQAITEAFLPTLGGILQVLILFPYGLVALAILVISTMARAKDAGGSELWGLLILAPLINLLLLIALSCVPSKNPAETSE